MPRPSTYSDDVVNDICARLAAGQPLTKICKTEEFPDVSTVYRWLDAHEEFRDKYARARQDQADTLADEIIAISDEQHEAVTERGVVFDPEVNRDRLRIDARKWVAAKLKPKKYGDKTEVEHTGDLKIAVISYAANHDPA